MLDSAELLAPRRALARRCRRRTCHTLTKSSGELALDTFRLERKQQRSNPAQLFVRTESWLTQVAEQERTRRKTSFWLFEGLGASIATLATLSAIAPDPNEKNPYLLPSILYSEALFLSAMGFFVLSQPTPTERMLNLYHEDPGAQATLRGVAPTEASLSRRGFLVHFPARTCNALALSRMARSYSHYRRQLSALSTVHSDHPKSLDSEARVGMSTPERCFTLRVPLQCNPLTHQNE